jgi:hypothetical protein
MHRSYVTPLARAASARDLARKFFLPIENDAHLRRQRRLLRHPDQDAAVRGRIENAPGGGFAGQVRPHALVFHADVPTVLTRRDGEMS